MSQCVIGSQKLHSPGSFFLVNFPSLSRENRNLHYASHRKWHHRPRVLRLRLRLRLPFERANCASESASYGGWDDPGLAGDSDRSAEQFRKFLATVGIDDQKQIFVFLLGLLCALAISRVRVSSIVVFPASVLVFAVGFSFGLVRGGGIGELYHGGNKKREKDETFRVYNEKFKGLDKIVDNFDVNVSNLKYKVQKAIDSREVTVSDLEDYTKVLESIGSLASNARNVIEACKESSGSYGTVLPENQKSNKRKKELGGTGLDFLQSIGGLFRENVIGPKPIKVRNVVKRENVEGAVDDQTSRDNVVSSAAETGNKPKENDALSQDSLNDLYFDENGEERVRNGNVSWKDVGGYSNRFSDSKEYGFRENRLHLQNNHHISLKMRHENQTEAWESRDNLLKSVNYSVRMKHTETEASFVREQKIEKSDDTYRSSSHGSGKSEYSANGSPFREESIKDEDNPHPHVAGQWSEQENGIPSSSSSMVSDDAVFDRYLSEANDLLTQAKEFMRDGHEKERAEIIMYRCAQLLSKAIAMKPASLLAVGQLGNTYLLHGELKLRISRELRTLLYKSDTSSVRKWGTIRDPMSSKDDIASTLINVCEECEELLVEAGRKYRLALSIDGNDARALYNWGLALTFRAQLISDIGPVSIFYRLSYPLLCDSLLLLLA